jgi:uncharacterized membrane protein
MCRIIPQGYMSYFQTFKPTYTERMPTQRVHALDTLRGFAMVWMTLFHLCFDLNSAGVLSQDFHQSPWWTWQRVGILSLFLVCAGAGQAIAQANHQSWAQFGRRWVQIASGAALVSWGSWWMFPNSFIYFGVLHGMAVMLLLVRLLAPLGKWCALLGALILGTHWLAGHVIATSIVAHWGVDLDARSLNWLGLVTRLPVTEDYVPVIPWLGVMLLGFAVMRIFLSRRVPSFLVSESTANASWFVRGLNRLGRHSLIYYLLHQPILLSGLWLLGLRL